MIKLANNSLYINEKMEYTVNVQKILYFIATTLNKDFIDKTEIHDFWEIVYLESGEAEVEAGDKKFHLLSGEAFFHKPGEAHSIKPQKSEITVFFISFYSSSKAMILFENLKISLSAESKRLIYKICEEARNIFQMRAGSDDPKSFISKSLKKNPPLGAQQLYKLYIEEFLLNTAREAEKEKNIITYATKENYENIILEEMINFLSERIYSTVSINELCKTFNYSRTYLSSLFKKHRKTSIMNYYNKLKIKEAKKLLRDKMLSVSEVSQKLGFDNPYYFSRVFKNYENISPSEYKQNLKEHNDTALNSNKK